MLLYNNNRGITLVALILTIVILLILAVVTIRSIQGEGIIAKAMQAREKYEESADEEQGMLDKYLQDMEGISSGISQEGTLSGDNTTTEGDFSEEGSSSEEENSSNSEEDDEEAKIEWNGITLKIGDYVNYNPTIDENGNTISASYTSTAEKNGYTNKTFNVTDYTGKWRILGIENGRIQLTSANTIGGTGLMLKGEKGYFNVDEELNAISNIYGKGRGAESARSIDINDVNKITGFNPSTYKKFDYGYKYQYRYPTAEEVSGTRYMQYRRSTDGGNNWSDWANITWTSIEGISYQTFRMPGEKAINSSNPGIREITNTTYYYGFGETTAEDVLSSHGNYYLSYWIASSASVHGGNDSAYFNMGYVDGEYLDYRELFSSHTGETYYNNWVRPIVYLKSDVQLEKQSDGSWNIQ